MGVGFLFPPNVTWGLNSDRQAWRQVPLHAESLRLPLGYALDQGYRPDDPLVFIPTFGLSICCFITRNSYQWLTKQGPVRPGGTGL